ncbi:hypothetical protein PMAYCL1PPCAC_06022 [Pristionchus mayeri]|uniref:F-box domain-containing protein n=1 Tax=Pristionchus mayeri TaxID=1317129 RepID=A0AAN4Z7B6_9BILA|nr:hypothetical protein PMAYCL1PPCAC_06022 [Pristionchus mayeri]
MASEQMSLFSLPREILMSIIEVDSITLEDRMNLRQTCRALEELVADSEFYPISSLIIEKTSTHDEQLESDSYLTGIEGLIDSSLVEYCTIPQGRHGSFIRLMNRLFRKAHFDEIQLKSFNFRSNSPSNLMNADQLRELSSLLTCNSLRIDLSWPFYDPKILTIIKGLNPRETLHFHFSSSVNFDQLLLQNLPPVPSLTFFTTGCFFRLSDTTILTLVAKHRFISLGEMPMNLSPETLLEIANITSDSGHILLVTLLYSLLMEMLQLIGVSSNGSTLISSQATVKVCTTRHATPAYPHSDYTIELCNTHISIFRLSREIASGNGRYNVVVRFGIKDGDSRE